MAGSSPGLLFYRRLGKGEPLILIHGAMVSGRIFFLKSIAEELAKDFDVFVPDLRGHGASKHFPGPYTTGQHAEDIKTLMDALGVRSAHVLGGSYGGLVAQQLAYAYPAQVTKLVLASTISYNMSTFRERVEGAIALFVLRLLGVKGIARLIDLLSPEFKEDAVMKSEMKSIFADNQTVGAALTMREAFTFDTRPWVHTIACPTLIVGGQADIGTPIHHSYYLHNKIRGSRLEVFEGATHALFWTHTEKFVDTIKSFLGR